MSPQSRTQKKTIAKNAFLLYVRMLLNVVVSLYTSRVVLQTLGIEDYGIYGVVGGVVSMFSFLNAAMSGATSRFLTYEMGRGDMKRLKDTFSSAMVIHILIALVIFIFAETFGLWFLCNKLVIPEGRMLAAHLVFQFSVLSMFFNVTQVPYNSILIAHEKMDIYAYVELLNVGLKLGIVYLLLLCDFDKLILYAALSLVVSIIIVLIYRVYCLRHYEESSFYFIWDTSLLKPMLSFSGWDLYGNMSVVVFSQGIAMLLNIFFGPLLNAANNISLTVQGTIKGFTYNVIQAFRPQIIKQYAQGEIQAVGNYCLMATQYTLLCYSLMAIPLFFNADFILQLWLGVVPQYASIFLKIVLVGTFFNLGNNIVCIPIHAEGRMKVFSVVTGSTFLLALPIMYITLKCGLSAPLSYTVFPLAYLSCLLASITILKRNVPQISIRQLLLYGYIKTGLILLVGVSVCVVLTYILETTWLYLLGTIILNAIIIILGLLYVIMNKEERQKVYSLIKQKCRYGKTQG